MTRRWLLTPSSSVSVSYPDGWVASDPLSEDTPSSTISAGACITSWPLEIRRLPSGTCRFTVSKKKSQSFIQSTRQLVPTFERASIDSRSTGPPFQFEQSDRRYARPDQLPDYLAGANFEKWPSTLTDGRRAAAHCSKRQKGFLNKTKNYLIIQRRKKNKLHPTRDNLV